MIHKDTLIEELVTQIPQSVSFLMKKGVKCIACGEPIWGTLEDAAKTKGLNDKEIENFVKELNQLKEKELNP